MLSQVARIRKRSSAKVALAAVCRRSNALHFVICQISFVRKRLVTNVASELFKQIVENLFVLLQRILSRERFVANSAPIFLQRF